MAPRTIAIGDIHGCSVALAALVEWIAIQPDDVLVILGDYVDRGIDSKGVLDQLIAIEQRCQMVPLLGNHDEMMLHAKDSRSEFDFWLACGADSTLDSYGPTSRLSLVPPGHFRFLERCRPFFESETHLFAHANYRPELPLAQQEGSTLRWLSLLDYTPGPHCSGKIGVVGHTPQSEVLRLGHLTCIDTACCDGGWLTALDVGSGTIWQVDERGRRRIR